jgi:hypothetical protein
MNEMQNVRENVKSHGDSGLWRHVFLYVGTKLSEKYIASMRRAEVKVFIE